MSSVDTEIQVDVLNDLDFAPECDNELCDNKATHLIQCGCRNGSEFVCMPCIQIVVGAAAANPFDGFIQFSPDKSCGHLTHISRCRVSPL